MLTLAAATVTIVLADPASTPADHASVVSARMPEWLPIYPGAALAESKLEQDGVSGSYRFFAATDMAGVLDWYQSQLEARGFTREPEQAAGSHAARFTSQSRQLEVVVTLRTDGTREQADVVFGRL